MKNKISKKYSVVFLCLILFLASVVLLLAERNVSNQISEIEENNKEYSQHFIMICENSSHSMWQNIYNGAQAKGDQLDIYVEKIGIDNIERMSVVEQMEIAIAAKVDGIIVEANNSEEMIEIVQKATSIDIPVVTVLGDAQASSRVSYINTNSYDLGEMYGERLLDLIESGSENIAVMMDSNQYDDNTSNLIYSRIREIVSTTYPEINLNSVKVDNNETFQAEESIRDLLLDHSKQPDIMVCTNSEDSRSALQSIIDYNLVGQVELLGYYGSEELLSGITKGIVDSTVFIDAKQIGEVAVETLHTYIKSGYVSEYMVVKPSLIVAENVNEYIVQETE